MDSNYVGLLSTRLRDTNPALYQVLERCRQVASSEWLPAVAPDHGSLNSYPHIRNVEQYLDMIVGAYESHPESKMVPLSASETYLLLTSVLLHDLGKGAAKKIERKRHAEVANEKILKWFANYGIPSYEVAKSIAAICRYHENPIAARKELTTTVIDPYGEIRERFLAALLKLADMMDNAYTRVLPPYCYS